jgi:polynucleotide 5'-kinase involved in rRNA processing
MNWENIDLSSGYERSRNVLDAINSDEILLCLEHNVRELTEKTIQAEFDEMLSRAVSSARDVFRANRANYLKSALSSRSENEVSA